MLHELHFTDRLIQNICQKRSYVVLGLDPQVDKMPPCLLRDISDKDSSYFQEAAQAVLEFNLSIIQACAPFVVAAKPQIAFYECLGWEGLKVLAKTVEYCQKIGLMVIIDAKRNDIGHTARAYAQAYLGPEEKGQANALTPFDGDALTINPYLGFDGVQPFLQAAEKYGKGIFALVRTSNLSAKDIQDLETASGPVYAAVGAMVHSWGEQNLGNNGYSLLNAVVGATYPRNLV